MPRTLPISEQVRTAIENCGQTRYRISQATGVSQATLSRFMTGERALSQAALDAIGEYLGLRLVADKRRPPKSKGK